MRTAAVPSAIVDVTATLAIITTLVVRLVLTPNQPSRPEGR